MRLDAFFAAQLQRIRDFQPPQREHAQTGGIQHGTLACYVRLGCRCLPCWSAHAEYKAARRYAQR